MHQSNTRGIGRADAWFTWLEPRVLAGHQTQNGTITTSLHVERNTLIVMESGRSSYLWIYDRHFQLTSGGYDFLWSEKPMIVVHLRLKFISGRLWDQGNQHLPVTDCNLLIINANWSQV